MGPGVVNAVVPVGAVVAALAMAGIVNNIIVTVAANGAMGIDQS